MNAMNAKNCLIGSVLLLGPALVLAQESKGFEVTGQLSVEYRNVNQDPQSSKYNEYNDVRNGFPRYGVSLELFDKAAGRFFDLRGANLLRDEQSLSLSGGEYGLWRLSVDRRETPHNLSLRAMTPFRNQGGGLYTVDTPVPIPNRNLAPTAAQAQAGMLRDNDAATAAWLATNLAPTSLKTQRDKTGFSVALTPVEGLKLRVAYTDEQKDGSKISYGPIGDRPPRTLSRQTLAEFIEPRMEELYSLVQAELRRSGFEELLSSGIVITGGTSAMTGMVELGEEVFHMPVRLGYPRYEGGLSEVMRNPRYATGVGLLLAGLESRGRDAPNKLGAGSFKDLLDRMKSWFKGNF